MILHKIKAPSRGSPPLKMVSRGTDIFGHPTDHVDIYPYRRGNHSHFRDQNDDHPKADGVITEAHSDRVEDGMVSRSWPGNP
jgi:hypothetical protein